MSARTARTDDEGMTLIEVIVVLCLIGVLSAMAATSMRSWNQANAHKGTAAAVQSALRTTQVRAISEGVSFCVRFDDGQDTYTISRYACADSPVTVNGPLSPHDPTVRISAPTFTAPDGSITDAVTFRPTGSASPGSVRIVRTGSPKVYQVNVEGFTGRVSIT